MMMYITPPTPLSDIQMAPRVQLFYNPTSGSYTPQGLEALAHAFAAEGADVIATPSVDCLPVIHPDVTHVCIAGGDGTVRHVAASVAQCGRTLPVAIYPSGTVNLLAREGRFTRSATFCAKRLLYSDAGIPHHPVSVGETLFFACASIGPDSLAVARVSRRLKRVIGRFAYVMTFLRILWRWPRPQLRLTVDDARTFKCEAVYLAKGRYFAGPWSFAPHARVSDGMLHVLALPKARRRTFFAFLWAMLRQSDPGSLNGVETFTCRSLMIEGEEAVPMQADGDIVATLPVKITVGGSPIVFR